MSKGEEGQGSEDIKGKMRGGKKSTMHKTLESGGKKTGKWKE